MGTVEKNPMFRGELNSGSGSVSSSHHDCALKIAGSDRRNGATCDVCGRYCAILIPLALIIYIPYVEFLTS